MNRKVWVRLCFVFIALIVVWNIGSYAFAHYIQMPLVREENIPGLSKYKRWGFDVNREVSDGENMLTYALKHKHFKAAEELLHLGIDPISADANNNPAMNYAASAGSVDLVKLMLAKGGHPYMGGSGLHTFHYAAMSGNIEVIDVLLNEGSFNVNVLGFDQIHRSYGPTMSALSLAALHNHRDLFKHLLTKEADITIFENENPHVANVKASLSPEFFKLINEELALRRLRKNI